MPPESASTVASTGDDGANGPLTSLQSMDLLSQPIRAGAAQPARIELVCIHCCLDRCLVADVATIHVCMEAVPMAELVKSEDEALIRLQALNSPRRADASSLPSRGGSRQVRSRVLRDVPRTVLAKVFVWKVPLDELDMLPSSTHVVATAVQVELVPGRIAEAPSIFLGQPRRCLEGPSGQRYAFSRLVPVVFRRRIGGTQKAGSVAGFMLDLEVSPLHDFMGLGAQDTGNDVKANVQFRQGGSAPCAIRVAWNMSEARTAYSFAYAAYSSRNARNHARCDETRQLIRPGGMDGSLSM